MKVLPTIRSLGTASALLLLAASPAVAQYTTLNTKSDAAVGEKYNVEVAFGVWNPTPEIVF